MTYLQSLGAQLSLCCRTVGFGFLLGIMYDLIGLMRTLFRRSRRRFGWDMGYALLAAVCTFLFLLTVNAGKVRVFLLGALTIGFLVWLLGAGRPFRRRTAHVVRCVQRFSAVLRARIAPFFCLPEKCARRCCARAKKVVKKSNFLLKFHKGLVYNKK